MFFHGTAYSPKDDPWPGWRFYASVDMSPNNSIWRDAPSLMSYITRCQTYLQWGNPDNDFIVYLPVRDMWRNNTKNWLMMFDIHSMDKKAPDFIRTILDIDKEGFDCDYISDNLLLTTSIKNGVLTTLAGTTYKGVIIPEGCVMPKEVANHVEALKSKGANIIYGHDIVAMQKAAKPEMMKSILGLKLIRRSNDYGHHYFIANLSGRDIHASVPLAVSEKYGLWYDPMTDSYTKAQLTGNELLVNLKSGESRILVCSDNEDLYPEGVDNDKVSDVSEEIDLTANKWTLSFINEQPKVGTTYKLDSLQTWETLGDSAAVMMGTGVYETVVKLSRDAACGNWSIDLGDVRESARVYINNVYVGCAWAVPFVLDCKNAFKKGKNIIRIEVTNLPANRIADLDRKGVKWRKMKEINVVDINYKRTTYENWKPVPSGISKVRLVKN